MRSRTFEKMNKLRLLKINNLDLKGTFQHLFEELRWLCWHYCPLNYLPYNFQPEKLVILDMTSSDIKKISNNSLVCSYLETWFLCTLNIKTLIQNFLLVLCISFMFLPLTDFN